MSVTSSYAATASPATGHPTVSQQPAARSKTTGSSSFRLGKIKHVWLILLENEDESNTFSDKSLPVIRSLERKGLWLTNYYGTGHESLDNYISLTSGQAPNGDTQSDCQNYANFPGNSYQATPGEPGQQSGAGCVYPRKVIDIGNQLSSKRVSGKAYMEDMGNIRSREKPACGHPAVGSSDGTQTAVKGDGYATRHDPFVYYHRVIDNKTLCRKHVVSLGKANGAMPKSAPKTEHGLAYDLRRASRTPRYSFITPNLCHDGHDYPCKTGDKTYGSKTKDLDHWLGVWVPKIMKSAAYGHGGLIEITFDESDGPQSDSSSCCGEAVDPNALGTMPGISGPGGGKVGALFLSPLLKGGHRSTATFNHYSTLATDEAIFGLKRLGYATKARTFASVLRADARG